MSGELFARRVPDIVYGEIPIPATFLKLIDHPKVQRNRHVSMMSPGLTNSRISDSRWQHGLGTGYLGSIAEAVCCPELAPNLQIAGYLHDLGISFGSHGPEQWQIWLTGRDHEEAVIPMLEEDVELRRAVIEAGGEPDLVGKLITGKQKPQSDLLNDTLDNDNIDGIGRSAVSRGLLFKVPYNGRRIVAGFRLLENQVVFEGITMGDLKAWERTRKLLFDSIDSPANRSLESLLFQALNLLNKDGLLKPEHFRFTDRQALEYLYSANERSKRIAERLDAGRGYPLIYPFSRSDRSEPIITEHQKEYIENPTNRVKLADDLSTELGVDQENFAVYMGKSKGVRKIAVPLVNGRVIVQHNPINGPTWNLMVFLHEDFDHLKPRVTEICAAVLQDTGQFDKDTSRDTNGIAA